MDKTIGNNNLIEELPAIVTQLVGFERILNDSIDRTNERNHTYPTVARQYNQVLNRLKKLSQQNPAIGVFVNDLGFFEEKDFLPSGNYQYAVDLQTTIRLLQSNLKSLNPVSITNSNKKTAIPIVFISYMTDEIVLADFLKAIFKRLVGDKVEIFIAKRDIPAGDNPQKVMMESKLKSAQAVIPICSIKSKMSPWIWWEAAAVWARSQGVYPLFTNISPNTFGPPLTWVTQGRDYFHIAELKDILETILTQLNIQGVVVDFADEELKEYERLKREYSIETGSAKVKIDYSKLHLASDIHKYSLIVEVENNSKKSFDDVALELSFPLAYLDDKTEWKYPHLNSHITKEKPGYLTLTFIFSALNEAGKNEFRKDLLVGKSLKIFGEDGISRLHYKMTHDLWTERSKFEIAWKVYINGGEPITGSMPLNLLQIF